MWTASVDLYCERAGAGLLAEPLNALTNAAFFVAAWVTLRDTRSYSSRPPELVLLIGLITAIGVGSSLFHTFAMTWARVLDVAPILLFQLAFIYLYAIRVMGWGKRRAVTGTLCFLAAALFARQFPALLNGSLAYMPAIGVLFLLGVYHHMAGRPEKWLLIAAGSVLATSLFFRTYDAAVCNSFPLGTHFLWHLLNPIVLYLCVRSLYPALVANREAYG